MLFFSNLFFRCKGMIISPKDEWFKIKSENHSILSILINFLFPLLLIIVLSSLIGFYIPTSGKYLTMLELISTGLRQSGGILLSIVLSILVINSSIRTFGGTPSLNRTSKLVVYTYVPGIFVTIFLMINFLFVQVFE